MENIARMRTCKQIADYFKQEDTETKISEHYIRTLAKSGKIPTFYAGKRCLMNIDTILAYLRGELVEGESEVKDYGTLRRVNV